MQCIDLCKTFCTKKIIILYKLAEIKSIHKSKDFCSFLYCTQRLWFYGPFEISGSGAEGKELAVRLHNHYINYIKNELD
jgi:hypothetical protein